LSHNSQRQLKPNRRLRASLPTSFDPEFVNEFFTASIPRLRRSAARKLRNREDSEDVLQDALLAAYKNIHHFQSRARFATWMHAILCNSDRTMWRKRRARPVTSSLALDREGEHLLFIDDIPSQGLSPEEEYCRTEAAGTVAGLLKRLPPLYREVAWLCKIKEMNITDAAKRLGVQEGTIKARIHRPRRTVQGYVTEKKSIQTARTEFWPELSPVPSPSQAARTDNLCGGQFKSSVDFRAVSERLEPPAPQAALEQKRGRWNVMKLDPVVLLAVASTILAAQQSVPIGTILPVRLDSTLSQRSFQRQSTKDTVMQEVALPNGVKIPDRAQVWGKVTAIDPIGRLWDYDSL
jgi:RNA polymerase sigma-70 factor (ECF subfamily)